MVRIAASAAWAGASCQFTPDTRRRAVVPPPSAMPGAEGIGQGKRAPTAVCIPPIAGLANAASGAGKSCAANPQRQDDALTNGPAPVPRLRIGPLSAQRSGQRARRDEDSEHHAGWLKRHATRPGANAAGRAQTRKNQDDAARRYPKLATVKATATRYKCLANTWIQKETI